LHVYLFCILWWALDGPEDFLLWAMKVSIEAGALGERRVAYINIGHCEDVWVREENWDVVQCVSQ